MTDRLLALPFTRGYEDVALLMREQSDEAEVRQRYRRRFNQYYQFDMANYFEWDFLRREGTASLVGIYDTGTVDINVGATTVTGTGTTFTSAMVGRKIKFDDNDEIYTIDAFNSATSIDITPALYGGSNIDDGSFQIYQDVYALADDYGAMTVEPGMYQSVSGGTQNLIWLDEEEWNERFTTTPSDFATYWREFPGKTSLGKYQFQINPVPQNDRIARYEYFKLLDELREFTTGTVTTTLNSTTATTNADYSASISAGQFFRVDSTNEWRKISSVSGTTITLENSYPATTSAAAYTVCDALDIPERHHMAVIYGCCMAIEIEQGGTGAHWGTLYQNELDKTMRHRNRKRYGRRVSKRFTRQRRFR